MFIDICLPNNNEEEFIKVAEKLGTKGLLFLYDKPKKLDIKTNLKIFTGIITNKNPSSKDIYFSIGQRKHIENKNIKFHFGFESLEEKDSVHYKRSGINQVHAKLLKNKVVVFDMERIMLAKNKEHLLGRLLLNLKLIKKYKLNLAIASFSKDPMNLRAYKDYEAFIRSLGYQKEAKDSIKTLYENIK